ncbi:MAG TPA: hypothetical protein VFC44_24800 [Candidatus Saccharimonadales bacterium]|nr:hypothetical protein [Candidatus Saccharimonadales bacterium]
MCLVLGAGIHLLASEPKPITSDNERGFVAMPVSLAGPLAGNAGVFMGVNDFDAYGPPQSLGDLHYAVDDAVALAHLFVMELGLLPAVDTELCLSGSPTTDQAKSDLAELLEARVRVSGASRNTLLAALQRARLAAQTSSNILVIALSSHGFGDAAAEGGGGGDFFVMPADGQPTMLKETCVPGKVLEQAITERRSDAPEIGTRAGKRLLFVDACRSVPSMSKFPLPAGIDEQFLQRLAVAKGQVVVSASANREASFEDAKLGHGAFTYFLLEACRGSVEPNSDGVLTLDAAVRWATTNTTDFVRRTFAREQIPRLNGEFSGEGLPLARMTRAADVGDTKLPLKWRARIAERLLASDVRSERWRVSEIWVHREFLRLLDHIPNETRSQDPVDSQLVSIASDLLTIPWRDRDIYFTEDFIAKIADSATWGARKNGERVENLYFAGLSAETANDWSGAIELLKEAAAGGHVAAIWELSCIHRTGAGSAGIRRASPEAIKDAPESMRWTKLAAEAGFGWAMSQYGDELLHLGRVEEGLEWWKKNAVKGDNWTCGNEACLLGDANLEGRILDTLGLPGHFYFSVPKNKNEAFQWYSRGAELDDESAMEALGLMFEYGCGVEQSDRLAVEWFQKAADHDNDEAKENLARMFDAGRGGLPKDHSQAKFWRGRIKYSNLANDDRLRNLMK